MISTVTTSTVTTITSVTAVTGAFSTLAWVGIVVFFLLIMQKEILSTASGGWRGMLRRGLDIALVPLGIALLVVAGAQLLRVLA